MNPYLQEILHNITTRLAALEEAPKKEWRVLTDEEISAVDWKQNETLHDFARAIEAKLKEKNGF